VRLALPRFLQTRWRKQRKCSSANSRALEFTAARQAAPGESSNPITALFMGE